MKLFAILALSVAVAVAGCAPTVTQPVEQPLGPDGKPLPKLYRIRAAEETRIEFRMFDSVNSLRQAAGVAPLTLNAQLKAAAATHARDMAVQNRPWHFGSDGSSPIIRAQRVGYSGRVLGENISETYETELETLGAWMEDPGTKEVIIDPEATEMGFAWYQEENGKIWWTMVTGTSTAAPVQIDVSDTFSTAF